jgi:hypothetical protein
MSQLLRRAVERMPAPIPFWIAGTYQFARYPQVRQRRLIHRRILGRLDRSQLVSQGSFQGMNYIPLAYYSEILPKLVGTYERELIPAIEMICRAGCDSIVDIGAAEGFYAVGMALRNPRAKIVAFELSASGRYFLRRLAARNGVSDRIMIRGECNIEALRDSLAEARLPAVICDCEGAEDTLLRPDQIEPLRRSLIVVETHDGLSTAGGMLEGITDRLHERFAPTHHIELIASRPRSRDDLPRACSSALTDDDAAEAMNEGRPWAQWLFLRPKANTPD